MNPKPLFRKKMSRVWMLLYIFSLPTFSLADNEISSSVSPAKPLLQASGKLVFEEKFFDFGTVTEGDIVKHTFKLMNMGKGPARIVKTDASCGCTTLSGIIREYAPGEQGEMEVAIDTKGKKGIVVKTVTVTMTNNEVPTIEIAMPMKLEPPPHPRMEKMRNINAEAGCKTCHLESGVGETGVFLYHRVCAQCHGKKGVGGFGTALNNIKTKKLKNSHIRKVIREGLPENGMPAFTAGVTPPLSDAQVESLIQYIRKL